MFIEVCANLLELSLLYQADLDTLEIYAFNLATAHECERKLQEQGLVAEGKGRPWKSPYWSIYNEAVRTLGMIGSRFGFSLSDRTKIDVPRQREKDDLFD